MIPIGMQMAQGVTNQTITIQFTLQEAITWAIIGLIAGFLAGLLVRGHGFSILTDIIVGLIGAFVGGFVFTLLKIPAPSFLEGGVTLPYFDIVVAFIGAVLVLLLLSVFRRRRYYPPA